MTEGIIVAIIGAAGVILAAIIGLFQKNNTPKKNIKILAILNAEQKTYYKFDPTMWIHS